MKSGEYILVKAPENFPGTLYRGKYCYEHVLVYWQTYGIIPKDNEIIHHKDENKYNNDPDNLELLTTDKHSALHDFETGRRVAKIRCPECGNIFFRNRNQTFLVKSSIHASFCCRSCGAKFYGNKISRTPEEQQHLIDTSVIDDNIIIRNPIYIVDKGHIS